MATPRLVSLCPVLLRPVARSTSIAVADGSSSFLQRPPPRAQFRSHARAGFPASKRYGTANQPDAKSNETSKVQTEDTGALDVAVSKSAQETTSKASSTSTDSERASETDESAAETRILTESAAAAAVSIGKTQASPSSEISKETPAKPLDLNGAQGAKSGDAQQDASVAQAHQEYHTNSALTTILNMKPPIDADSSEDKPPHLQAPPYVHHFDTYSLVKSLQDDGGWSDDQSVEVMKAVRGILSANMDLARDGLVSKSDAEMESYLFKSACSELRTEVKQRRQTGHTEMASARTQLQHEVELLSQRIGHDAANMKDEVKGMFDERKMIVREERRAMESRLQELNYKITLALNSEMRSEVEGLRFVITRRVVMALAIVVFGALAALRFAKSAENKSQNERKKLEEAQKYAQLELPHSTVDMTTGELAKRIEAGDSGALVSLG